MSSPTRDQLMKSIQVIRRECDRLEEQIKELSPEKEWLSTEEFAEKAGLTLQTVSTYCGTGRLYHCHKNENGFWRIHKSELKKYN